MAFLDKLSKFFAREIAKEVLKSPEQKEHERRQKEANISGKELGVNLEFIGKMTQEEYERTLINEEKDYENIFNRVDMECKRICDRIYDLYTDYLNGELPKIELLENIHVAKTEVIELKDLAMDKNGHNISIIASTIIPAKKWLEEVEEKIRR